MGASNMCIVCHVSHVRPQCRLFNEVYSASSIGAPTSQEESFHDSSCDNGVNYAQFSDITAQREARRAMKLAGHRVFSEDQKKSWHLCDVWLQAYAGTGKAADTSSQRLETVNNVGAASMSMRSEP